MIVAEFKFGQRVRCAVTDGEWFYVRSLDGGDFAELTDGDGEFWICPTQYIEPAPRNGRPPTDADALRPRPLDDWHEDIGEVLWWKFPLAEPPYVGSPLDDDWPGNHTHWTPIQTPTLPCTSNERT